MKTWLFNPFKYIAGWQALVIGWAVMLVTAWVAFHTKTNFDGVIDAHWGLILPFSGYFVEVLIDWTLLAIALYAAARIFSKTTFRAIDIAGTTALARWPMIFVALLNFFMRPIDINGHIPLSLIGIMVLEVAFSVWMIVLTYRAFSVSCNLKGQRGMLVFVGALVVAEILSKVALKFSL